MWDSENKRIAFCGEGRGRYVLVLVLGTYGIERSVQ